MIEKFDHWITLRTGNIFQSDMQTIVNPVNCDGVMGAGLAKEFKTRFPDMFEDYARHCAFGRIDIGHPWLYKADGESHNVLCFPTKDHWRDPSKLEYLDKGFDTLEVYFANWGITSIAFPALGVGLGGLSWNRVRGLLLSRCQELEIPTELYAPKGMTSIRE